METPCADLGGLFRPLTVGIAFLSGSQVCPEAGKWVSPNKLERQALQASILFVVMDHCPTPSCSLRACSARPEVFRFASISFIAAMSRISASVNCRVEFCVILNMIGIVPCYTPEVAQFAYQSDFRPSAGSCDAVAKLMSRRAARQWSMPQYGQLPNTSLIGHC